MFVLVSEHENEHEIFKYEVILAEVVSGTLKKNIRYVLKLFLFNFLLLLTVYRGSSRAQIWTSVELCQVKGQPKASSWLLLRGNILEYYGSLIVLFIYCVNVF